MITLSMPETDIQLRPRITVFGVGGAGGNAVNNMIKASLEGVDFVVANTDAQALAGSLAEKRLQIGTTITRGLGAGSRPDVGRAAAEEQIDELTKQLDGANMVFITAGMGGGTGTGAAPVIARVARERGILTVGVVTKPFHFEGAHRMRLAESGIAELTQFVDTLIIIPNQNLFRIANEKTTFADAFKMADDVLQAGVRGVTDLMVMPGLINLDFADIRSVMTEMGKAMMGTGEASGERRAIEAAEAAISNPLLDDVSMKGARGVLINITGGLDMTLFEVDEAANRIRDEVDPDANIIFGSTFDETLAGRMRVSVVSTGIDSVAAAQPRPAVGPGTFSVVSGGRQPGHVLLGAGAGRAEAARLGGLMAPSPLQKPMASATSMPLPPATAEATARVLDPALHPGELPFTMAEAAADLADPRSVPVAQPAAPAHANPLRQAQAERPAGAPRGERRDDSFIPPRPADPGPRPSAARSSNAGARAAEAPRRRGGSFLDRFADTARRLLEGGDPDQRPAPDRAAPVVGAPRMPAATPAETSPPATTGRAATPAEAQPGAHASPRVQASPAEEDVLDIPAFLRRQAN